MVDIRLREGITEFFEILKNIDKNYIDKIPLNFRKFLENNREKTYKPNLDFSKELKDMKLREETKNLLAIMYLNYWSTGEEKKEYIKLLNENEKKYQEKLRVKYNPDNLFENKTQPIKLKKQEIQQENALIEVKENFFTKFIKKIKNIFAK